MNFLKPAPRATSRVLMQIAAEHAFEGQDHQLFYSSYSDAVYFAFMRVPSDSDRKPTRAKPCTARSPRSDPHSSQMPFTRNQCSPFHLLSDPS